MKRRFDFLKIIIITLIVAAMMSGISITIYSTIAQPQFYDKFMALGNRYLDQEKYNEAVLEFNKAITIDKESTDARVGVAKGNIGLGDIDGAVKVLKEAQSLEPANKKLLMEMVDVLRDPAPEEAYQLLCNYIEEVGEYNVDSDTRELFESATAAPVIPDAKPEEGVYVQPFTLQLEKGKTGLGHVIHYTTDGTTPNRDSEVYTGSINIDKSMTVKFIGFNANGDETYITKLNYVIDPDAKTDLEKAITDARAALDSAKEGTDPGNHNVGAKKAFIPYIENAERVLANKIISRSDAENATEKLNDALEKFNKNIVAVSDKTELKSQIDAAEAIAGSYDEDRDSGSMNTLNDAITSAKKVYDDERADQDEVDSATRSLKAASDNMNKGGSSKDENGEVDARAREKGAKTGEVTVTLLWDTYDDLDLYVRNPKGETIYQGKRKDSHGGYLDIDAQSVTFESDPLENVYWENAPEGTYSIQVKLSSDRNDSPVPFKVRIIVDGESKVFEGSVSRGTQPVGSFTYKK